MVLKTYSRRSAENNGLWFSIASSAILPMLLGFLLMQLFPEWRWTHYPFHAMVESVGAFSALTISALMMMMVGSKRLPTYYLWVACALISMGLLDGVHAVFHASGAFVWLHSLATLLGGLAISAIWLPESWFTPGRQRFILAMFIAIPSLAGVLSAIFPDMIPVMVINGQFSLLAKAINILGGIGFLLGTAYFAYLYLRTSPDESVAHSRNEDLVFANHYVLFGAAALLFESSVIWDAGWWWWHILRLVAYLVVLLYFFILFHEQQEALSANEKALTDINRELENRVRERTRQLEQASNAKTEFLSSMSHELRTPMNAILGFGQLLELDEKLNATQKASVNEILQASKHLMELINEILDLARIEEGKIDVRKQEVDLSKVLYESISLVIPFAQQYNIKIINNTPGNSRHIILGDGLRIRQVLINLISNAIKYNLDGGSVTIDIDLNTPETTTVSITDTGPGIPSEDIDRLFTPFERLGNESHVTEGAGIGLALSRKLMRLMDGDIRLKSIPGQGSTFFADFPRPF